MDNPLTPNKIQRLIHLAEDKSFNVPRRLLLNDEDVKRFGSQLTMSKSSTNYESSSGILDLERVEGFGESGIGNMSLSKSTAFNPGEMTGRSTEADDLDVKPALPVQGYNDMGRHSLALDNIQSHMDKQTLEINDIMRHSIATNYSFHSKRDLTADEASLVIREAPLPVPQSTQINIQDSISMNHSDMSVGAYFKNRCPEFGRILGKTDSPDRSMQPPSITDVSVNGPAEAVEKIANHTFKLDSTLDSVPVRQCRFANNDTVPEKLALNSTHNTGKVIEKQNNSIMNLSNIRSHEPSRTDVLTISKGANLAKLIPGSAKKLNQIANQKPYMTSSKPTDVLLRNLQSSLRMVTEDTEGSMENSLSISKIADYLGKQSNISVSDMLQLNNHMKQATRKQPLTELHVNLLDSNKVDQDVPVTYLKDTRKTETASSSGTVNTVISLEKLKLKNETEVPAVVVTPDPVFRNDLHCDVDVKTQRLTKSKSPSSKSQSTLSTVQENITSFKSGDSMHSSKGEANISNIPSPNIGYKELDKSVDWHEVLQQKRLKEECLAKEQWADIVTTPVHGFVGVCNATTVSITTLTDSWLTAKLEFDDLPNEGRDLTVELPRLPLLLSPGKTEQFTIHITSNIEMTTTLSFIMYLKDASIDGDIEQKGCLEVKVKMPTIQAVSSDGVNKISFPPMQEKSALTKSFVLISDCPVDLKLELSVTEGDSIYVIKSVQEIKRNEVSKALMNHQGSLDQPPASKPKGKGISKQLCRLTNENAIKVSITFNSPKLADLHITEKMVTFNGTLSVNLIGVNTVLKRVSMIATVGTANLAIQPQIDKLQLTNEPTGVTLTNTGSIHGAWVVKFASSSASGGDFPFNVSPTKLELHPGCSCEITMSYTGSHEILSEATLILEDVATCNKTTLVITGGTDTPKVFPIKTNLNNMTWVSAGRKDLSLKNFSSKKVQIRCQILGEGFSIDLPGMESRGIYCLAFAPCECRPLPIVFTPTSNLPHAAALHIVCDKNTNFSRKIKLHACARGEGVRWARLVTYGCTALLRALPPAPVDLPLYNKAPTPAFLAATVHFNLQYLSAAAGAQLAGARRVVAGRARAALSLRVPWPAVERRARAHRAAALATLTVLTGPEYTRRRILRILKSESKGELDLSMLPDHLKVLVEPFEGEDPSMDKHLENFKETKAALRELIEDLQELTAQIDLPQDFSDDNTILISDDTVVEHHTLCD